VLSIRNLLGGIALLSMIHPCLSRAAIQQTDSPTITLRATTTLVFLDITVLDKQGRPVTSGLTKDDFTITEDNKPQRIFSFDAPRIDGTGTGENKTPQIGNASSTGSTPQSAPATIFVLDLLNSPYGAFSFIRDSASKYLAAQPAQLLAPTQLMVLGNQSLDMVQGFTRSRADLLSALDRIPRKLPFKISRAWGDERLSQSIEALQQIALQNRNVSGKENIVWLGYGGPSTSIDASDPRNSEVLRFFAHDTTNMLVDARMTLFMIYPGLNGAGNPDVIRAGGRNQSSANQGLVAGDPFAGAINFGLFVNGTGGRLFYDRNDMGAEIDEAQELGSKYYTLTYSPQEEDADGKFRSIRVTLRNPNLRAVTRTGYFAPEQLSPKDARRDAMVDISEAAQSAIPFHALTLAAADVVRHPDSNSAEVSVILRSKNINWQPAENGKSSADIAFATVALSGRREILASKVQGLTILLNTQDPQLLSKSSSLLSVTIRVPHDTRSVRLVVRTADDGQIGTLDLDRKTLDAAPASPTQNPPLLQRAERKMSPPSNK
jgi:VWFA-related protein